MRKLALIMLGLFWSTISSAAPQIFESGEQQTVMIELYTSQGCNSCPPAEEYLNSFVDNPDLWKRFIPIALHVDYWDYLGWKDRFSKPEHSNRQRFYARVHRAPTVFTPAFFVNGKNWRPGLLRRSPVVQTKAAGNLRLEIDGQKVSAVYKPADGLENNPRINIALLGIGLRTKIQAGENAGRHSRHDFVLLETVRVETLSTGKWRGRIPTPSIKAKKYAIVAWVSGNNSPAPLQSVGGYLQQPFQ